MKSLKIILMSIVLLLALSGGLVLADNHKGIAYEVTIQNLTGGQPFSPPIIATHKGGIRFFKVGKAASPEIQAIAENGNNVPLATVLGNSDKVFAFEEAGAPLVPSSNPGGTPFSDSVTFMITADKGANFLSAAMMLICTNDGFTGLDRVKLPKKGSVVHYTRGYDAGTEINTEDFADIVPPCQGLIGVTSDDPGTGETNPALAEDEVIRHHPGIEGGNDLLPEVHGWTDPVAKITITVVAD